VIGLGQSLYTYPTRLQSAIYSQDPDEGEQKSADGINITTNDNANTVFDITVIYRVKPEDVLTVFNTFGAVTIQDIQTNMIRRAVKDAVNGIGTRYNIYELMGPKRQEASEAVTGALRADLGAKGITIDIATINQAYPNQQVASKIASRVNALTEVSLAQLRNQQATIDKQSALITASAQAKARSVASAQVQGKGVEMMKLDTDEAAIANWKGALPMIKSAPGQTVILSSDTVKDYEAQQLRTHTSPSHSTVSGDTGEQQ